MPDCSIGGVAVTIYPGLDTILQRIGTNTRDRSEAAEQIGDRTVIGGRAARVAVSRSLGMWILVIVAVLIVAQFAWSELREWVARRRAIKRGRTLTAKYGIPWR